MPSRNGDGSHAPPGSSSLKTKKQLQQHRERRKRFPAAASAGLTLDPLLIPRLQAYSEGNKTLLRDIDGVVEHLCRTFREYKRKPKGVFSKTVERAIAFVLAQDGKIHKKKEKEEEEGIDGEEKDEDDGDDDSIESIPFISEPVKKKRSRSSK